MATRGAAAGGRPTGGTIAAESIAANVTCHVASGTKRFQPNRTGTPAADDSPKRETVAAPRYSSSTEKSLPRPAAGVTTIVSPVRPLERLVKGSRYG
jgi:hypothetical protein